MELKRPGGELANRPLHFFWVVDCSGSMGGDKIDTVNHAIQECIQPMRDEAAGNPNAQLFIRTLKFSGGASWVTPEPVPIEEFEWTDLDTDGITDLGKALDMVADQLEMPPMPARALPPVIVLLSDGYPTDDWKRPLERLQKLPWGKKAVKIAIAIGSKADKGVLETFTGNPETVLSADNRDTLVHLIKWASTAAAAVSQPASVPVEEMSDGQNYLLTPPPVLDEIQPDNAAEPESTEDVW